jgi:aspartyl-tRNA(Asn)/glutamyl-tRNA(Gln) amidotransferase subunit B
MNTELRARKDQLINGWEVVIGLEIHCQLNTQTKIFSGSPTTFGAEPNTQASLIDLALPGTLPVLNREVVNKAVRFGLGVDSLDQDNLRKGAEIGQASVFARKNYFYPDLPKGYQISQMDDPIVGRGQIEIEPEGEAKKWVGITRAHLEEDAGKSLHEDFAGMTGIDLNRAGTPLLEIVSEPDMRSTSEALAYVRYIHKLVRWLGISDGNMDEGSFRCDCNVSIRRPDAAEFGTRCELKNINSFRFIERAIVAEVERQIDLVEGGGKVIQQTRLYDANKNETRAMRSKEEANDYRYFPDPDLLPVMISNAQIEQIRGELPELFTLRKKRFVADYGLSEYDADILTGSRELADFYETAVKAANGNDKIVANWVMGDLLGALNKAEKDLADSPVTPAQLGGLVARIADNTISGKIAKVVFVDMMEGSGQTADDIITAKGLKQETDSGAIEAVIKEVLAANEKMVEEYRAGKEKAFNGLVGQIMKASKGKANPAQVNELLKGLLG